MYWEQSCCPLTKELITNEGSDPAPAPIAFSFGETLVDFFEDHRAIGGGSLNVAWYLGTLGLPTAIVSAVGPDELGAEIREFLAAAGVDTSWIIERPEPTGTVDVRIVDGEPQFRINDSAWDHIELARIPDPVPELVYFGTVAQRREANRRALGKLLALGPRHRFYDVNLREGYYTGDLLEPLLRETTILKFTDEEFEIVAGLAGVGTVPGLMERYGLEMVALTKGERGADLYAAGEVHSHPGLEIEVADVVGAGDAFSGVLAAGILLGAAPERCLEAACIAGANVVRHPAAQIPPGTEVEALLGIERNGGS